MTVSTIETSPLTPYLDQYFLPQNQVNRPKGELICLEGIMQGYRGFNIYPVDERQMLVRVASEKEEKDSRVALFVKDQQGNLVPTGIEIPGEDPFCTKIKVRGKIKLLVGAVQVGNHPLIKDPDAYYTALWMLEDLSELAFAKPDNACALTPLRQKDIRIFQNPVKGTFRASLRPQGNFEQGGAGVITVTPELKSIEELSNPSLYHPDWEITTLKNLFWDRQTFWGGANQLIPFAGEKDLAGMILHIAHRAQATDPFLRPDKSGNVRVYRIFGGVLDTLNRQLKDLRLICTSKDLPPCPARQIPGRHPADLENVVFPGGLIGSHLYGGLKDMHAFRAVVNNPFTSYRPLLP